MNVLAGLLIIAVLALVVVLLVLALVVVWLVRRRRHHPGPPAPPPRPPPAIPDHFDEPGLAATLAARLSGPPASGAPAAPALEAPVAVVWVDAGDEVLVHLDSVRTRILAGALVVSVDLESDQTGRAPLVVAISLGGAGDEAGLVGITDELPRGSPLLAARWGTPLQEAVWSGLLGLAADHALERGLAPRGVAVAPGRLTLAPGARLSAP